jgi:hypothetical protein
MVQVSGMNIPFKGNTTTDIFNIVSKLLPQSEFCCREEAVDHSVSSMEQRAQVTK